MEIHRLARQANTATNVNKNTVESSEIPQIVTEPYQGIEHTNQQEEVNPRPGMPNLSEILQKESQEVTDLVAMEEGATAELNGGKCTTGVTTSRHCRALLR